MLLTALPCHHHDYPHSNFSQLSDFMIINLISKSDERLEYIFFNLWMPPESIFDSLKRIVCNTNSLTANCFNGCEIDQCELQTEHIGAILHSQKPSGCETQPLSL